MVALNKPCYKKLYAERAKECQICKDCETCSATKHVAVTRRSAHHVAIQHILLKGKCTFEALSREMMLLFPEKQVNVYNCLNELKAQGVVRVETMGRTRYYKLR